MRLSAVAAALALLLLSACSQAEPEVSVNDQVPSDQATSDAGAEGADGGGDGGGEVAGTWAAGNTLMYDEAPSQLPAGDITIALELTGGLPHNVTFEGVNGDDPIVEGTAQGEYTGSVTLEPGEYTYYCGVVGHREGGMEGTVTVA